jgi:condensin complex subunit 2
LAELDLAIQREEELFQDMQADEMQGDDWDQHDDSFAALPLPNAVAACPARFSPARPRYEGQAQDGPEQDVPLIFADQKEDLDFVDPALLKNWAGASHWKFKKSAGARGGDGGGGGARSKSKQKIAFQIDFFESAQVPEIAFAVPTKASATVLAAATLKKAEASKYVLPVDMQIGVKNLLQLFLRPELRAGMGRVRSRGGVRSRPVMASPIAGLGLVSDDDDDDDEQNEMDDFGGMPMMDDFGDEMSFGEQMGEDGEIANAMELVAEPTKVGKVDIGYAKFAKKVDVKQLKKSIWKGLQLPDNENDKDKEEEEEVLRRHER